MFCSGRKSASSRVSFPFPCSPAQDAYPSSTLVEDPSENFEDMRDKTDLYTLLSGGDFKGLSAPLTKSFTEEIRKKYKLADVGLSS